MSYFETKLIDLKELLYSITCILRSFFQGVVDGINIPAAWTLLQSKDQSGNYLFLKPFLENFQQNFLFFIIPIVVCDLFGDFLSATE